MKLASRILAAFVVLAATTAGAQTTTFYDFNTAGDLALYFNESAWLPNVTESMSGLGGSGDVNLAGTADVVYSTKQGYSNGGSGAVYRFEAFFRSVW